MCSENLFLERVVKIITFHLEITLVQILIATIRQKVIER